jgi:hypothetical protein
METAATSTGSEGVEEHAQQAHHSCGDGSDCLHHFGDGALNRGAVLGHGINE